MEGFMGVLKFIALAMCFASFGWAQADARTYDYCQDASLNTLGLLIRADTEMLAEMQDNPYIRTDRKTVENYRARMQECPVYKDYCRKHEAECAKQDW